MHAALDALAPVPRATPDEFRLKSISPNSPTPGSQQYPAGGNDKDVKRDRISAFDTTTTTNGCTVVVAPRLHIHVKKADFYRISFRRLFFLTVPSGALVLTAPASQPGEDLLLL